MAEKNSKKPAAKQATPFQKEQIEVLKQINQYKLAAEANVVSIIYKDPELLHEANLTIDDFFNNEWKVFFTIADDLIRKEMKNTLDIVTFNLYLEKHPKLERAVAEFGGYESIEQATTYVKIENFDGYLNDLKKMNALVKLVGKGFPVPKDKLSIFNDMTAEEIYDEYTAYLNDIFVNIDNDIKSYNGFDGIHELIDEADKGDSVGLPLYNAEILTKTIGGINLKGNIYGLGAGSGVGKSTMAINWVFPSVMYKNEQAVFIINEEDERKFRREALIWTCSNHLNKPIPKHEFRDGKFSPETKKTLHEAADWLEEKKNQRNITVIPLERYSVKIACKLIKKYAAMGVKLFVVDTFKESYDIGNEATWKSLERDMVMLYDTVKPKACNVGLIVTYQLSKTSLKARHLTNADIGQGRSIVDTMSCNLMMRRPFDDEFKGEKRDLKPFYYKGKNDRTTMNYEMDKKKHYMLTFIGKNRFGATDEYAILSECDLSTNIYKDVAYCIVPEDFT